MENKHFLALVVLGICSFSGHSFGFSQIEEVPKIFLMNAQNGYNEEALSKKVLGLVQARTRQEDNFTLESKEKFYERDILKKRHEQLAKWLKRDENFDGAVTLKELQNQMLYDHVESSPDVVLQELAEKDYPRYFNIEEQGFRALDKNNDSKLDIDEMSELKEDIFIDIRNKQLMLYESLFVCDSDQNQAVTLNELERCSANAFKILDSDSDGIITRPDLNIIRAQLRRNN